MKFVLIVRQVNTIVEVRIYDTWMQAVDNITIDWDVDAPNEAERLSRSIQQNWTVTSGPFLLTLVAVE